MDPMKRLIVLAAVAALALGGFSDGGDGAEAAQAPAVQRVASQAPAMPRRASFARWQRGVLAAPMDSSAAELVFGRNVDVNPAPMSLEDPGGGGGVFVCYTECFVPRGTWGICWDPQCQRTHAAQCTRWMSVVVNYWVPRY